MSRPRPTQSILLGWDCSRTSTATQTKHTYELWTRPMPTKSRCWKLKGPPSLQGWLNQCFAIVRRFKDGSSRPAAQECHWSALIRSVSRFAAQSAEAMSKEKKLSKGVAVMKPALCILFASIPPMAAMTSLCQEVAGRRRVAEHRGCGTIPAVDPR